MNKTLADILRIIVLLCLVVLAVFTLPETTQRPKAANASSYQAPEHTGSLNGDQQITSEIKACPNWIPVRMRRGYSQPTLFRCPGEFRSGIDHLN